MEIYILSLIFIVVFIVEFICIKILCNLINDFLELANQQNAIVNKTYQQNMALCEEKQLLVKQVVMLEKRIKELEENKGE